MHRSASCPNFEVSTEQTLMAHMPTKHLGKLQFSFRRATLNVGGVRHLVQWSTIKKIPGSRLTKLATSDTHAQLWQHCDDFDLEKMEFFFDWNPQNFSFILNAYRTLQLHAPDGICTVMFKVSGYFSFYVVYINIQNTVHFETKAP